MIAGMREGGLVGCHSGHRIVPFRLTRPSTIDEALAALREGATVMAGGIDLVERMKDGFPVGILAHLGSLAALKPISFEGDVLRIGAGATHQAIAADATIRSVFPDLARIWGAIGNIRVRSRGSLGGNIMAGVAAYEASTILAACGASATFMDLDGRRFDVPVVEAAGVCGLMLHVSIPEAGRLRLSVDRTLRDYATVARADRAGRAPAFAVGGVASKPIVWVGEEAGHPSLPGPHAVYLGYILPGLLDRMRHD